VLIESSVVSCRPGFPLGSNPEQRPGAVEELVQGPHSPVRVEVLASGRFVEWTVQISAPGIHREVQWCICP